MFGLPIWQDESLWDDQADYSARRLSLEGTKNAERSFYRRAFAGSVACLDSRLFALDLYSHDGLVQKVVVGFINRADIASVLTNPNSRQYDQVAEIEYQKIRIKLIQRLGQPSQRGGSESWTWLSHDLILNKGPEALTLSIQKVTNTPGASSQDQTLTRKSPLSYLNRTASGDTLIGSLPPVSQGDRGYCVPASWEKVLLYHGLNFNVYELAQAGGTKTYGTQAARFSREMENLLTPLHYKVRSLPQTPRGIAAIKPHIDQGLPVIWYMNAATLREWVGRNSMRNKHLPPTTFSTKNIPPAYHALLIIGYNEGYKEIALSDSTELGSSLPSIWIHEAEFLDADLGQDSLTVIVPPATSGGGGFIKPRWY
ncbi:MAG: hypothetical protein HC904_08340 [Blastochloris sp.]|nr:hypothetical protein [Blastochloris sp.]